MKCLLTSYMKCILSSYEVSTDLLIHMKCLLTSYEVSTDLINKLLPVLQVLSDPFKHTLEHFFFTDDIQLLAVNQVFHL